MKAPVAAYRRQCVLARVIAGPACGALVLFNTEDDLFPVGCGSDHLSPYGHVELLRNISAGEAHVLYELTAPKACGVIVQPVGAEGARCIRLPRRLFH